MCVDDVLVIEMRRKQVDEDRAPVRPGHLHGEMVEHTEHEKLLLAAEVLLDDRLEILLRLRNAVDGQLRFVAAHRGFRVAAAALDAALVRAAQRERFTAVCLEHAGHGNLHILRRVGRVNVEFFGLRAVLAGEQPPVSIHQRALAGAVRGLYRDAAAIGAKRKAAQPLEVFDRQGDQSHRSALPTLDVDPIFFATNSRKSNGIPLSFAASTNAVCVAA